MVWNEDPKGLNDQTHYASNDPKGSLRWCKQVYVHTHPMGRDGMTYGHTHTTQWDGHGHTR